MGHMDLVISTLAERPALMDELLAMENPWPEFIRRDPFGDLYYHPDVQTQFADHILLAHSPAGELVAKAHAIPFRLEDNQLPDGGWDNAIQRGILTKLIGSEPNTLAALEIFVRSDKQGMGLSGQMLAALREHARRLSYPELVVPVRPNGKVDIHEPMSAYAQRTRADGLPVDPWLRVHVRAGGRIDRIAPHSMVIAGTLDQWQTWTGLPMNTDGQIEVPQALTPVICSLEQGTAVYTEPNVWVRHRTGA